MLSKDSKLNMSIKFFHPPARQIFARESKINLHGKKIEQTLISTKLSYEAAFRHSIPRKSHTITLKHAN